MSSLVVNLDPSSRADQFKIELQPPVTPAVTVDGSILNHSFDNIQPGTEFNVTVTAIMGSITTCSQNHSVSKSKISCTGRKSVILSMFRGGFGVGKQTLLPVFRDSTPRRPKGLPLRYFLRNPFLADRL